MLNEDNRINNAKDQPNRESKKRKNRDMKSQPTNSGCYGSTDMNKWK